MKYIVTGDSGKRIADYRVSGDDLIRTIEKLLEEGFDKVEASKVKVEWR